MFEPFQTLKMSYIFRWVFNLHNLLIVLVIALTCCYWEAEGREIVIKQKKAPKTRRIDTQPSKPAMSFMALNIIYSKAFLEIMPCVFA